MKRFTGYIIISLIAGFTILNAQDTKLKITVGGQEFTATLNSNETVNAFLEMLPMTVNMTEMGGYEKYHYLPQNLPGTASNVGTTYEGDLMIWSGNCLVLFYNTRPTSYSYIRLGRIDNINGLKQAVGSGNVQVNFELKTPSVGIENVENPQNLYQISPNPVTDYIDISGEFEQLSIFNANGQMILQSKESTIYTHNIPAGVYFLKIKSEKNGITTRKIIKK